MEFANDCFSFNQNPFIFRTCNINRFIAPSVNAQSLQIKDAFARATNPGPVCRGRLFDHRKS
jgi:hypothetical protein